MFRVRYKFAGATGSGPIRDTLAEAEEDGDKIYANYLGWATVWLVTVT